MDAAVNGHAIEQDITKGLLELMFINPDCGLRTRSWEVSYNKLRNMVEGASMARDKLGG